MQSVDHRAALERFLGGILVDRRERLLGFATSGRRRTQQKFLATLLDELERLVDPGVIVPFLPASTWDTPAFVFAAPRDFGTPAESLDRALEAPPASGASRGRLVITDDGVAGCLDTEWCGRILVIGRRPAPRDRARVLGPG